MNKFKLGMTRAKSRERVKQKLLKILEIARKQSEAKAQIKHTIDKERWND